MTKRRLYTVRGIVPIVALAAAGICGWLLGRSSAPQYDTDWVARQWSTMMRTYLLDPVYPPSEDIAVGDVYALDADDQPPDQFLHIRVGVKIGHVDLTADLHRYYAQMPVFPQTLVGPTDGAPTHQLPVGMQVAADGKTLTGVPGDVFGLRGAPSSGHATLPLEAFPGFTIQNTNAQSVSASWPARMFDAVFGAARSHADATAISVRQAEGYALPAIAAYERLDEYCFDRDKYRVRCTAKILRNLLPTPPPAKPGAAPVVAKHINVALVRKVVFVRQIDYHFDNATSAGAQGRLVAQLRAAAASAAVAVAVANSAAARDSTVVAQSPPLGASDPAKSAQDRQAALTALLTSTVDNLAKSSTPGVGFSLSAATEDGITLTQTFERPVAVGYSAVEVAAEEASP
jgi:hypothetical protein